MSASREQLKANRNLKVYRLQGVIYKAKSDWLVIKSIKITAFRHIFPLLKKEVESDIN